MTPLAIQLRRVRRRLLCVGTAAAAIWALGAATMLLLLSAWFDLLWELSPEWRVAACWSAAVAAMALLAVLVVIAARAARDAVVARRLDRAGDGGGRILTGWELARGSYGIRGEMPPPLSADLASLAVADAAAAAARVPLAKAAPLRPLGRSLAAMVALVAVLVVLALALPALAWTQWNRFLCPFDDVPPFSLSEFRVEPGNTNVIYGGELEIRATVIGAPVDQLELVFKSGNHAEPPLPMFPEPGGVWRAVLAKVVEPADYYVRAYQARSLTYHVGVKTVPLIDTARLRIVPPSYAHRAPYDGPLPKDGVSGLASTQVQIFLRSNRPLRGGTIAMSRARPDRAEPGRSKSPPPKVELPMRPVEVGSPDVMGQFSIDGDGKFQCRVVDEAGQASQQSFSGSITLLADERPFVRITEPQKTALATPTATLPVVLSAEDDCGVSHVQLFRSLNDSRFLPVDLALPLRQPRRVDESVPLPLERYGLEAGDVIKLFGRVEDNDPAGAKGSESPIVTVRIVSQEEFEQMLRTRGGVEAMLAKYYQAQRRMEALAKQVEELQKKLEKLPPGDKLTEETRRALADLRRAMAREAAQLGKLAEHPLPYDLDKFLTPRLRSLARLTAGMAKELEKLEAEKELRNGGAAGAVGDLARRLAAERKEFDQRAAKPLEYFEAVFPLLIDEQRFVNFVHWQRDLAERLAALRGRDRKDDPAAKARMRDLEQEQRQIGDTLARLLDDIQEHSQKLPEAPELMDLRRTAQEFVKDVRESGAAEAMSAAEAALGEFAASRAQQKAEEAANILDRFIKRCKGMGEGTCRGLHFQPTLSEGMGNTIDQLLAGMGPGSGMGGYGMIGMYGGLPEMFGADGKYGGSYGGRQRASDARGGQPHGENPDEARPGELFAPGTAGGSGDGSVPIRYRRQVGQYFQRVAEETEEK